MTADKGVYIFVTPKENNSVKEFRVGMCSDIEHVIANRVVIINGKKYDVSNLYKVIYFGPSLVYTSKSLAFAKATEMEEALHKRDLRVEHGIRFIRCEQPFPCLSVDEAYRLRDKLL